MAGYVYRGTEFDAHLPVAEPVVRGPYRLADREPPACGTRAGYSAHRRNQETACWACNEANNAYLRDYKERVAARTISRVWSAGKCGTTAGYAAHRRYGVPVCEACKAAQTVRARECRLRRAA